MAATAAASRRVRHPLCHDKTSIIMEAVSRTSIKHHFAHLPRVLVELIGVPCLRSLFS
jgi:hypothetical protein